jgi:hypothetical protein
MNQQFVSSRKLKRGGTKGSAASSANISCVRQYDPYLKKMKKALSV